MAMVADRSPAGLWLAFCRVLCTSGDGQVRASYSAADGLGEGRVNDFRFDRDGTCGRHRGRSSRLKTDALPR
jgi:hypothetical protein